MAIRETRLARVSLGGSSFEAASHDLGDAPPGSVRRVASGSSGFKGSDYGRRKDETGLSQRLKKTPVENSLPSVL